MRDLESNDLEGAAHLARESEPPAPEHEPPDPSEYRDLGPTSPSRRRRRRLPVWESGGERPEADL